MKKLALLVALGLTAAASFAQTDMITALQTVGDKVVYTEYWDIVPVAGGKNTIGEKRYVVTLKPVLNRFGKVVGFDGLDAKDPSQKKIEYNYMYSQFDHYTHPSHILKSSSNIAYLFINGVIFELEKFSGPESFEIDKLWIPAIPKDRADDPIFKGAKMSDLRSANLVQMVKDYLNGMKKIQEANPYNETIQMEVNTMKFAVDSTNETYRQKNANYWNSPEGQKKLAEMRASSNQPTKKTIQNTGTPGLTVIYDNGMTTHINGGSSSQFPCRENVYYAVKDASGNYTKKGTLISGADQDCGKTITAAGGN